MFKWDIVQIRFFLLLFVSFFVSDSVSFFLCVVSLLILSFHQTAHCQLPLPLWIAIIIMLIYLCPFQLNHFQISFYRDLVVCALALCESANGIYLCSGTEQSRAACRFDCHRWCGCKHESTLFDVLYICCILPLCRWIFIVKRRPYYGLLTTWANFSFLVPMALFDVSCSIAHVFH